MQFRAIRLRKITGARPPFVDAILSGPSLCFHSLGFEVKKVNSTQPLMSEDNSVRTTDTEVTQVDRWLRTASHGDMTAEPLMDG